MSSFKTLNIWYAETICLIDFKLTESNVQANRSLYTNFQAILKFYIKFKFSIVRILKLAYLVEKQEKITLF